MPIAVEFLLSVVLAYSLGSISWSYIASRIKGFDIRQRGSGNAGTSNVAIVMGLKVAIPVCLGDILKGTLAVLLTKWIFSEDPIWMSCAGCAAVLGHIFPPYMGFRGGKGYATVLGVLLAFDWRFFFAIGIAGLGFGILTDYIVYATLFTVVATNVFLGITQGYECGLILLPATVVIFVKHIENFRRIREKSEKKISALFKKKPKENGKEE